MIKFARPTPRAKMARGAQLRSSKWLWLAACLALSLADRLGAAAHWQAEDKPQNSSASAGQPEGLALGSLVAQRKPVEEDALSAIMQELRGGSETRAREMPAGQEEAASEQQQQQQVRKQTATSSSPQTRRRRVRSRYRLGAQSGWAAEGEQAALLSNYSQPFEAQSQSQLQLQSQLQSQLQAQSYAPAWSYAPAAPHTVPEQQQQQYYAAGPSLARAHPLEPTLPVQRLRAAQLQAAPSSDTPLFASPSAGGGGVAAVVPQQQQASASSASGLDAVGEQYGAQGPPEVTPNDWAAQSQPVSAPLASAQAAQAAQATQAASSERENHYGRVNYSTGQPRAQHQQQSGAPLDALGQAPLAASSMDYLLEQAPHLHGSQLHGSQLHGGQLQPHANLGASLGPLGRSRWSWPWIDASSYGSSLGGSLGGPEASLEQQQQQLLSLLDPQPAATFKKHHQHHHHHYNHNHNHKLNNHRLKHHKAHHQHHHLEQMQHQHQHHELDDHDHEHHELMPKWEHGISIGEIACLALALLVGIVILGSPFFLLFLMLFNGGNLLGGGAAQLGLLAPASVQTAAGAPAAGRRRRKRSLGKSSANREDHDNYENFKHSDWPPAWREPAELVRAGGHLLERLEPLLNGQLGLSVARILEAKEDIGRLLAQLGAQTDTGEQSKGPQTEAGRHTEMRRRRRRRRRR